MAFLRKSRSTIQMDEFFRNQIKRAFRSNGPVDPMVWVADGQEVGFPPFATNLEDREMSKLNHTDASAAAEYATVHLAFELSKANWHLGVILPRSQKLSRFRIDGGDLAALSAHLAEWRAKAGAAGKPVRIVSCYEAG